MTKNNFFIESLYSFKLARRNIIFRLFAFFGIVGLAVCLFTPLSQITSVHSIDKLFSLPPMDWISQALTSSIPFKAAYQFNLLQLFFVSAIVLHDRSRLTHLDAMESLQVRPQGNTDISAGDIIGKLLAFSMVNGLSLALCALLNFLFYTDVFNPGYYFFYWATLNLPTLVFCLGISTLVGRLVNNQGLSVIILSVFLGGTSLAGAIWLNGLLDPLASCIPNMFSDLSGHVNLNPYLLQRTFILLAGVGLAILAVIPYPRIHNSNRAPIRLAGIALIPLVLATASAGGYYLRFLSVGEKREAYREALARHERNFRLKITGNHLLVRDEGNGGISVTSTLTMVNRDSVPHPVVLYLNPGLEVTSVLVDGEKTKFQRDQQVLLPEGELGPGKTSEVAVSYRGNIDNSLCFLDTPPETHDSPDVNSSGIYRFGNTPAICKKDYKLLTPGCIWYPVSTFPLDAKGFKRVMFSRYSMEVEHNPGETAISQGSRVERENGKTTFTFDHDMTGISLCIGNYKRREIIVDSVQIEFFYSPDHEFMLDSYDKYLTEEYLVEAIDHVKIILEDYYMETGGYREKRLKGQVDFDPTLQYPYRRLTLVEVPCDFHCFAGKNRLTGEKVQEGIVFLPERKYSMDVSLDPVKDKALEARLDLREALKIFTTGSWDLDPTLGGGTSFIHSEEYPVISDILALGFNPILSSSGWKSSIEDEYLVVDYLKNHSLEDALQDPSLPAGVLDNITRKKSDELKTYLWIQVGKDEFIRFFHEYLAKHLFKETTFREFSREFHDRFNIRLDTIIEKWYRNNKLAALEITDQQKIATGEEIFFSFKVFNWGESPGIVMAFNDMGWIIPPGKGQVIKFRYKKKERILYDLTTILASNLPAEAKMPQERKEIYTDTTTGIFPIPLPSFAPINENEIVVDNEDAGFSIVETRKLNLASLLGKVESRPKICKFPPDNYWGCTINSCFHGFPLKSAFYKKAGDGNQKARWEADLPRKGKYEVFCYQAIDYQSVILAYIDFSRKYYYTVSDGSKEHEVVLAIDKEDQGWMSLGVFDFHGKASVTLSDKDCEHDPTKEDIPQIIIADAIKWVKVQE